jgi:heptaprenyl diphosphate synthase
MMFRSRDLFGTGLFMTGAFLANPSTLFRSIQCLFFCAYALLMGKKINLFITLSVMTGIMIFNLLVPYGKVLAEVWGFPITQGALLGGLHRAVTMEGLIMLSKASIRRDLRFPGSFGALLGESLLIFQRILDRKGRITRKSLIESVDALMLELSAEQECPAEIAPAPRTARGILILGAASLPIFGLTGIGLFLG